MKVWSILEIDAIFEFSNPELVVLHISTIIQACLTQKWQHVTSFE